MTTQVETTHNPFLCYLCAKGARDICPIAKGGDPVYPGAEELRVLQHAEVGGHYLMCDCAYCAHQRAYFAIRHDAVCLRKPFPVDGIPTIDPCSYHGREDCHCDCAA